MIVLMRPPSPISFARAYASTTKKRSFFFTIWSWTSNGSWSQTSSGPKGAFRRKTPPLLTQDSMSCLSRSENWWQATRSAFETSQAARIGASPKRRWDVVTAPAFFES